MTNYLMIEEYMTPMPIFVALDCSIEDAYEKMKRNHIRHLPVLHEGKFVGLVTERDIRSAMSLTRGVNQEYKVEDVYLSDPYCVVPTESLVHVLDVMLEKHIGSVLIVENAKLKGIFTSMTAVRLLRDMIKK